MVTSTLTRVPALAGRTEEEDIIDMPVPAEWHALQVQDERTVQIAVDFVLASRERLERVKLACKRAVAQAQAIVRRAEDRWLPELEAWATENRPKTGKTHRFPVGSCGFRSQPERLVVADEGAALAWAREHLPSAVKTSESLLVSVVQAHFRATGEMPPGTELTESRESFFVGE